MFFFKYIVSPDDRFVVAYMPLYANHGCLYGVVLYHDDDGVHLISVHTVEASKRVICNIVSGEPQEELNSKIKKLLNVI